MVPSRAKTASAELQTEYLALKSFVFSFPELGRQTLDPGALCVFSVLEPYELPLSKRDLASMKLAINDCVSASSHWSSELVFAVDSACRQRGILTLSEVRRKYSNSVTKILARGWIKSHAEYYLVDGLMADSACKASAEQRASLQFMSDAYQRKFDGIL